MRGRRGAAGAGARGGTATRSSPPSCSAASPATTRYGVRELFAPVLAIEQFGTPQEAWALANAAPYGLSAAVYGRDPDLLAEAAARIRAGVLALNRRGDDVELEAPFGGRARSGNGQPEGGAYAYAALTDLQAVYG